MKHYFGKDIVVAAAVVVVVVVEARQAWFDQVQMTKQEHCDAVVVVVAVVNEDMVVAAAVDDVAASAWAYVLLLVAHQGNFQVGWFGHLSCPGVVVVAAVTYGNPSFRLTYYLVRPWVASQDVVASC